MKNIYLLHTNKPSILFEGAENDLHLGELELREGMCQNQNVYITSDEYIGLSYYLDGDLVRKGIIDDRKYWKVRKEYKKIILTTDIDLIKDGVQPLDYKFLQWFIENPTCEEVKIEDWYNKYLSCCQSKNDCTCNKKRVIIPKEEPFTEIQQKSLEASKALVKSLSPEELDSLMAEFDDMESEQETFEEAIGIKAHEYSMQYIGTDKYTVSMLAIEFGYQLAQQQNKNLSIEKQQKD